MPDACTRTLHNIGCGGTISKPMQCVKQLSGSTVVAVLRPLFLTTVSSNSRMLRLSLASATTQHPVPVERLSVLPTQNMPSPPVTDLAASQLLNISPTYQGVCGQPLTSVKARCPQPGNRLSARMVLHCSK